MPKKSVSDVGDVTIVDAHGLPDKALFRVDEVADFFGVSVQTIYLWIAHGHLIAEKYNRIIRIPRRSIVNFKLNSRLRRNL